MRRSSSVDRHVHSLESTTGLNGSMSVLALYFSCETGTFCLLATGKAKVLANPFWNHEYGSLLHILDVYFINVCFHDVLGAEQLFLFICAEEFHESMAAAPDMKQNHYNCWSKQCNTSRRMMCPLERQLLPHSCQSHELFSSYPLYKACSANNTLFMTLIIMYPTGLQRFRAEFKMFQFDCLFLPLQQDNKNLNLTIKFILAHQL